MEHEHRSVNSFAMMHGLYLGLALVLNLLIFYIMGDPFSNVSGYLNYAIMIAGVGFSMWTFAKLNTEEGLPYSRALGLGTLVSLFGSIIIAFFTYVLYKFIEPGLIDKLLSSIEEKLLAGGYKDDAVESMLSMQKKFLTPGLLSFGQVFGISLMGFIFSLILAIFLKKEPENPFHGVDEEGYEEEE
jgi:hypothetical protein